MGRPTFSVSLKFARTHASSVPDLCAFPAKDSATAKIASTSSLRSNQCANDALFSMASTHVLFVAGSNVEAARCLDANIVEGQHALDALPASGAASRCATAAFSNANAVQFLLRRQVDAPLVTSRAVQSAWSSALIAQHLDVVIGTTVIRAVPPNARAVLHSIAVKSPWQMRRYL